MKPSERIKQLFDEGGGESSPIPTELLLAGSIVAYLDEQHEAEHAPIPIRSAHGDVVHLDLPNATIDALGIQHATQEIGFTFGDGVPGEQVSGGKERKVQPPTPMPPLPRGLVAVETEAGVELWFTGEVEPDISRSDIEFVPPGGAVAIAGHYEQECWWNEDRTVDYPGGATRVERWRFKS